MKLLITLLEQPYSSAGILDVIFKGNLNKSDLAKYIHISDILTMEILNIWSKSVIDNITSIENLLSLPL